MEFKPIDVDFNLNQPEVSKAAAKIKADITSTTTSSEKAVKRVNNALEQQVVDWKKIGKQAQVSGQQVGAAATGVKTKFNGLSNSVNQLTREFPAFAVSGQTGILAISNNIPILVDEIAKLKAENQALTASGQKGVPVWKQLTKSLFGWQTLLSVGIGLLTIYGREVSEYIKKLVSSKDAINDVERSQKALNEAYNSSDFQKAVKDVTTLRVTFEQAREGTISHEAALKQYNDTLGDVLGQADDLNTAEQLYIDNSQKYIEATLARKAADLLAAQTAQQLIEYRQQEIQLREDINAAAESARKTAERNQGRGSGLTSQGDQERLRSLNQQLRDLIVERDTFIASSNSLLKEFKDKEVSFGLNFDGSGKQGRLAVNGRQRLLDRIAELDREYALKRLSDDAAEVQALKDKFAKIREEIERFNADKKNKVKIDVADLDSIEVQATADLLKRQEEARAAARQKKVDAELLAEQEQYKKLLEQLMTYQDKRLTIENEYADKLVLLTEKYQGEEFDKKLAELTRQKDEELQVLTNAAFKESELYRQLNEKILGMTRQQIKEQIDRLKQGLKDGVFTSVSGDELALTPEMIEEILAAVIKLENKLKELDPSNKKLLELAKGFDEIRNAATDMAQALETLAPGLGGFFETIGDLAGVGKNAADSIFNFKNLANGGTILGGVTLGISAIAGLFNIAKKSRESYRQAREELKKIQAEAEDGERRLNALQRERNLLKAKELELTLSSLSAQRQALLIAQRQINNEAAELLTQLQGQSFISGSSTERYGGFLGIGRKTRVVNEYASLLGKTFEEIEALYERGKLDGRAKELFEELRRLKEEGVDVQQQLAEIESQANQIFTGTTSEAISDSIIEGFKNGYRTVEDFAGDMETMLRNAMLNGLKFRLLEPAIDEFYKQFAEYAESGGGLDASELDKLREQYQGIVGNFLDQARAIDNLTGSSGQSQQRGLVGSIRRDLTEETGAELAGLYRAQYDISKRHFQLDEKWFAAEQAVRSEIIQLTVAIEYNTRMTRIILGETLVELKAIKTNTKPTTSGRDTGYGG